MKEEKVQAIKEKLEIGMTEIFESEKYKSYLSCMSKFHQYSYRNVMLILMQNPEASRVAGFVSWKNDFGRNVKKGERGISILAPSTYSKEVEIPKQDKGGYLLDERGKIAVETKKVTIPTFRTVTVFDVSQTEGRELPRLTTELKGEVEQGEKLLKAISAQTEYDISIKKIEGEAKGYCDYLKKEIVIKEGLDQAQIIKTAIHELAHSKMHEGHSDDRQTREVQAEAVAYVVTNYFGLDSSEYSFGYIANWSSGKSMPELKTSLDRIQKQSGELIRGIENDLQKTCGKEVAHGIEINL